MLSYMFPAIYFGGVAKGFHSLSKQLLLCHFCIQLLTFISNWLLGSFASSLNEPLFFSCLIFCLIEAFEQCLSCNNYVFKNINYLLTNGTAEGSHIWCSYGYIDMAYHDSRAIISVLQLGTGFVMTYL